MREIVAIDGRNRISLGKYAEEGVTHYIISKFDDGSITLTPAVIMPVTTYRGIEDFVENPEAGVRVERPRRRREPVTLHFKELNPDEDHSFIIGDAIICANDQEHQAALNLLGDLKLLASFHYEPPYTANYTRVTVTGHYATATDASSTKPSDAALKVDRVA